MASKLGAYILDFGLTVLDTQTDKIYLVSADPTTYTEAVSTFALGVKDFGAGNVFGSPVDATPNGRKVSSAVVTNGAVTATGTATGWAVVTSGSTRLDANGQLASPQVVTNGNSWSLDSYDIRKPAQ